MPQDGKNVDGYGKRGHLNVVKLAPPAEKDKEHAGTESTSDPSSTESSEQSSRALTPSAETLIGAAAATGLDIDVVHDHFAKKRGSPAKVFEELVASVGEGEMTISPKEEEQLKGLLE